jgi:hypothetical protein
VARISCVFERKVHCCFSFPSRLHEFPWCFFQKRHLHSPTGMQNGRLFVCLFILGFTATLHLCDSPTLYYYYGRMINVFFFITLPPLVAFIIPCFENIALVLFAFLYALALYHHHYCCYTHILYIDTYPCTSNEST